MNAIQTIGTLLLVAVLVLAILNYASVFNLSDTLVEIRNGVARLLTWLVPSEYKVELIPIANVSRVTGDTIYITANTTGTVGKIELTTANVPVEIVIEGTKPIALTVESKSNATVYIEDLATAKRVTVYPAGKGTVVISVTMANAVVGDGVTVYYRKL